MMNLKTYIETAKTSQRAFAGILEISPSFLNEILQGVKEPGLDTAQKIEAATGGQVPLSAWPKLAAVINAAQGGE